jgi:hypothetical protein
VIASAATLLIIDVGVTETAHGELGEELLAAALLYGITLTTTAVFFLFELRAKRRRGVRWSGCWARS